MSGAAVPVLAIDGPSGVGKGTVARALARRFGWHFLDSGALYRILALRARAAGVATGSGAALAALAPHMNIVFHLDENTEQIVLDGRDVTAEVRAETTGALASAIAVHPQVRAALLERQRAFRRPPGLVADGRDMGTVVFPDASAKVFLEASAEERARRRQKQLSEQGITATLPALCADIRARDIRDRSRQHSPLKPADDAVVIDTTEIPPEAVIARVEELIRSRGLPLS